MKLRFPIDSEAQLFKQLPLFPSIAIDTDKVVAYQLTKGRGDLPIWFEGVTDSVIITYKEVGEDNFWKITFVRL